MSFTNQTPHYGLPQYIATDVPTILQDLNGAYQKIDEKIYNAEQAGDTASADVVAMGTRVDNVETQIGAVDAKADANTTAITNLGNRVTTAENNIASVSQAVNTKANASDVFQVRGTLEATSTETCREFLNRLYALLETLNVDLSDPKTRASLVITFSNAGTYRNAKTNTFGGFEFIGSGSNAYPYAEFSVDESSSNYKGYKVDGTTTDYASESATSYIGTATVLW